jgi:hypothetical protein
MAVVKCGKCLVKDEKTLMTKAENKKFYHTDICYDSYLADCEFIKDDYKKWCDLYEYLKVLHDVPDLPPRNTARLQNLRNGLDFKNGKKYQRYKMGAEYDLMKESYVMIEDKIRWFMSSILDKENKTKAEEINSCITMMTNGLTDAWKERQRKIKQDLLLYKELTKSVEVDMSIEKPIKVVKKKDELDISDML